MEEEEDNLLKQYKIANKPINKTREHKNADNIHYSSGPSLSYPAT
jgi:hypothetical protein